MSSSPATLRMVKKFHPQVTRIKMADQPLDIEVLKTDIKHANIKDHAGCAVAEACKRSKKVDGTIVALSVAYLVTGKVATKYKVPTSLSREIVAFDRKGTFEPGHYKLTKPNKVWKGTEVRKRKKYLKPRFKHLTQDVRSLH